MVEPFTRPHGDGRTLGESLRMGTENVEARLATGEEREQQVVWDHWKSGRRRSIYSG